MYTQIYIITFYEIILIFTIYNADCTDFFLYYAYFLKVGCPSTKLIL